MATRLIEPSTPRLVLRRWRDDDRAPFAAMNADRLVMEHLLALLTRAESDALVDRCIERLDANGWGLWAVEVRPGGKFIGFVGLVVPTWEAAFTPCTEIGWRLARWAWGHGYATEAANAALATAFGPIGIDEVISFASTDNFRSQRVMQRLGMTRDPSEDFDHPRVANGRLRRHVLYPISRANWERPDGSHQPAAQPLGLATNPQHNP